MTKKMFQVIVEYTCGAVKEYTMCEDTWFNYFYPMIEYSDAVEHYVVNTL